MIVLIGAAMWGLVVERVEEVQWNDVQWNDVHRRQA